MLVGFVYLIFAGCSSNVENEIIGEWEGETVKQNLLFHEYGHIEMKDHKHGLYDGQYIIEDGNKLRFDFERLSRPIKCTAKISGKKLTLVHPGGREEIYYKK